MVACVGKFDFRVPSLSSLFSFLAKDSLKCFLFVVPCCSSIIRELNSGLLLGIVCDFQSPTQDSEL